MRIKEKGRTQNEIRFVLILNGLYKGYDYLDKSIELANSDDYLFYLQPQNNRDIQKNFTVIFEQAK